MSAVTDSAVYHLTTVWSWLPPASAVLPPPAAAEAQRGYDLHGNRLCQKALILAQALSKSSDFLICAPCKSEGLARVGC